MKKLLFVIAVLLSAITCKAQAVLPKGGVTQIMNAGRIVDLQEVTTLPYTQGQGAPFSILLVPKSDQNLKEIEFVKVRMYQGDNVVNAPVVINAWNNLSLVSLDADNSTLFTNYWVYVGFGQDIEGL